MTPLEILKTQMQDFLALAQAGHDVWGAMDTLSQRIREAEESAIEQEEAALRDHGLSLVLDGDRVATAITMEQARVLSVALLQTHEDWSSITIWRYGHEDEGRAEAVASRNHNSKRIYFSLSTGGG